MDYQKSNLESNFLNVLQQIPDPPSDLWQCGKLPDFSPRPKVVSIVGSRKCTSYGQEIAYRTAYELARLGVVIVSGLAYGIDSCAHRGCLDADGVTVAVLGTPIDKIYPQINQALAHQIIEKGAIISEYAAGSETRCWHFLERNRLVSGLADALLIVEASDHSGTLTTAALALDQGRDVFVVPGDITRPMSVGCNRLIQQGAHVFTCLDDLATTLFPHYAGRKPKLLSELSNTEQRLYELIKQHCNDGDDLVRQLDLTISEFNQTVTLLELKGYIKSLGGNEWTLA